MGIEKGFEIILHAGNAKSMALESIAFAETNEFEKAKQELEKADKDILDLLANGQKIDVDLILAHALDHLSSAELICILAQKFIHLYERIGGK